MLLIQILLVHFHCTLLSYRNVYKNIHRKPLVCCVFILVMVVKPLRLPLAHTGPEEFQTDETASQATSTASVCVMSWLCCGCYSAQRKLIYNAPFNVVTDFVLTHTAYNKASFSWLYRWDTDSDNKKTREKGGRVSFWPVLFSVVTSTVLQLIHDVVELIFICISLTFFSHCC